MKVNLKTTFDSYGRIVTGHIEDVEMYEDVKNGKKWWKDTSYPRITHIRVPKEVFERLLELDREDKAKAEAVTDIFKEFDALIKEHREGYLSDNYFYDEYAKLKKKHNI